MQESRAQERGDFADGNYTATVRRNPNRIQILLQKEGNAWGIPLKIMKGITLSEGSNVLEIAYLIEGLPQDKDLHFGVEYNFAGLPDGQDDRFFTDQNGERLGHLGSILDLVDTNQIKLTDSWLGVEVGLEFDKVGGIFTYPVQTVSQSEAGFELVHQCVSVQPHWLIRGDSNGRWSCKMRLTLKCGLTEFETASDQAVASN